MGIPQGLEWFDPDDKKPEKERRLILFSTKDNFKIGQFKGKGSGFACQNYQYIGISDISFWSYLPKPRSFVILQKAKSTEGK